MEKYNKKKLLISFLPLVITFIIYYIAYFAAFFMTFITGGSTTAASDGLFVNEGFFNIIRFMILLIIFAVWYKYRFYDLYKKEENTIITKKKIVMILFSLIITGVLLQLFVSAVLSILMSHFPDFFKSYNEIIDSFKGSKPSYLTIFSVIILAPIAEELIFRGVTFCYQIEAVGTKAAIIFQAIAFGLYHLNLVQGTYAFFTGLLLGAVCYRYKNLLPAIILHMAVNASSFFIPASFYQGQKKCTAIIFLSGASLIFFIYYSCRSKAISIRPSK